MEKAYKGYEELLAEIPPLAKGSHNNLQSGACIMEAVAFVAREPWSDHPTCACPVIGTFLRNWNDNLEDNERDMLLRPLIPLLVGTRSTKTIEKRRAIMCADWLIREHTPAWLRLAGLTIQADALTSLPEITDFAQCPLLMPVIKAAQNDANAAWAAAGAAAWDAAWYAAGAAAGDAAGDAAGAAAGAAAWAAAGAAAWAAAGAAAWDAAWYAAGAAAGDAAGAALKPTKQTLQQSALTLVHRMIAVRVAVPDK